MRPIKFRTPDGYQIALLLCAGLVVLLTLLFAFRELRPEYKIYQDVYIDLERFRSNESGEPPPPFKKGVKQILVQDQNVGPETIDRCTSCHVAMNLPHFSPTRIAQDVNGNLRVDSLGHPILEENPDYIFTQLDLRIAELREEGDERRAQPLERLQVRKIEGREVDMRKALIAHPLIGREIRPFQFHPIEEYGCTSCHSGNGRSVTAERAHGPVFDGHYEESSHAVVSPYVEVDFDHDPQFAAVFNAQPGHDLLFQTEPILVGDLMEARCLQCHKPPQEQIDGVAADADLLLAKKRAEISAMQTGIANDRAALISLFHLRDLIERRGLDAAKQEVNAGLSNPALSSKELDALAGQRNFLYRQLSDSEAITSIDRQIDTLLGNQEAPGESNKGPAAIHRWMDQREEVVAEAESVVRRLENATQPLRLLASDPLFVSEMADDASRMLAQAERGRELFFNQACYACHRIDGLSRGQVGPDLTEIGLSYPWYVKLSIVWPQGKLPSSTMPNFKLDHTEVEDLMAFLMAQTNDQKALSEVDREVKIAAWEAGHPMPWERPILPSNIQNLDFSMTVYATEGCASCHKLHGFTSDVGFAPTQSPEDRIDLSAWFRLLFPEQASGHEIAQAVGEHAQEIDERIVRGVHKGAILERIEAEYPEVIGSYYTNFAVAARANRSSAYQERLHRVMMLFVQEYGLGRDIAPRLSWSGIFRSDQWLMGHFRNPSAYSAKSIMPVFPFDNTKFYSLNHMLHALGQRNRDALHLLWTVDGFQPALAYDLLCSACHGNYRQGDGVVSEWIYPIPKNLRNATFLRNLTKEQAVLSITRGVSGTPMPPWGEAVAGEGAPILSSAQIEQLVDWLYSSLPGETVIEEGGVEKWNLTPEGVMEQLHREGEIVSSPILSAEGADESFYFIKREYYTESNLQAGEKFFLENCAHCHGTEGEGNGLRAEAMTEAKPRMLTNLPWIATRDDLRLLQSIQFGVPGTSMTPWGDQTSALQRIQLVMYIRTLSQDKERQNALNDLLYDLFDQSVIDVERCRISSYGEIDRMQASYLAAIERRERLYEEVQVGQSSPDRAAEEYATELALMQQLQRLEERDALLQELIAEIGRERQMFSTLGLQVLNGHLSPEMESLFFQLMRSHTLRYEPTASCLAILPPTGGHEEGELIAELDRWINERQRLFHQLGGKIWDVSVEQEERELMGEINRLTDLKTNIVNQLRLSERSQQKQFALFEEYQNGR